MAARPVKFLLPYYRHLRAVKWPFIGGVAAGLGYAAASGLGLPLMTGIVFPILFREEQDPGGNAYTEWMRTTLGAVSEEQLLLFSCLWIPLVFAIRGAAAFANGYLINRAGFGVVESIRTELFIKLQRLPIAFFRRNKSGDLLARVMNDTDVLRQALAQTSSDLIKQPATLLFSLGLVFYLALQKSSLFGPLIVLLSIPLCAMIIRIAGKKMTRRARALQARGGDLAASLSETLQSPLEIRAYNLQDHQIATFRDRIRTILALGLKVVKYRQAIAPSVEVVAACGFAAALYFGYRSGLTMSDFMKLGTALYMSYEPIKKLGNVNSVFRQAQAAVERIEVILHEPDSIPDPVSPRPCPIPTKAIRFENVTFAYGDDPVLHDIELEIPVGQVVALVGPSGAGKSTFASLIPRFYDPRHGAVTFDGIDIREFSKHELRSRIAIVPQMPTLFLGSFADNIRVGRLDATDDEVEHAARRAHAHDFISAYPDGYRTSVGERGDLLSGGQRQRIAIARAFLRDAPILILDEATSALDSESEATVQAALTELVKGRTTFIIAHRFSTITIADRILAFQRGRITADGTHESLRGADPIYRAMIGSELVAK